MSEPVARSSTLTPRFATMFEIKSAISQVGGIWNLIVTCNMIKLEM